MFIRALLASLVLLALTDVVSTGHRASCTVVRYYVTKYSAAAAEAWARSHGATDAEIDSARRCLSGSSEVQTASYTAAK
jgi:hypothetical protein